MSEMNYPPEELDLKGKIDNLMNEWRTHCKEKWKDKVFVSDGFFPYYTKQDVRVLFIGRESYGATKEDYDYIQSYNDNCNTPNFHDRLLYLVYGIVNGEHEYNHWLKMPNAARLNESFVTPKSQGGFSYAFMNATKLCNADSTNIDVTKFKEFISDKENQRCFIEEIRLINPNIIVSANLGDLGFFTQFGEEYGIIDADNSLNNENCYIRYITLRGRNIPWIDGWHFSAHKMTYECFYSPICSIAKYLLKERR